jgi:phosphoribosylanthranilate isomerase
VKHNSNASWASPQIKVCGLTLADEAVACVEAGADAIGLVFYPPSPRFVSEKMAHEISGSLPKQVWRIGVFVNAPFLEVMKKVEFCRLSCVQLHGTEPPEMVRAFEDEEIRVIKSIFAERKPSLSEAALYGASAYLFESGKGAVPGGAGLVWKWSEAGERASELPSILAGGLSPENVGRAIWEFGPDAVDVSSGVESEAGRKDIGRVRDFVNEVRNARLRREPRRIFK